MTRRDLLVSRAPPPAWADVPEILPETGLTREHSNAGRCALLSDTQVNIAEPTQIALSRTVYEVTSQDGLQAAANINVVFDPGFQTLVIHHVRVVRDGGAREIDPIAGIELLRREPNLERAVFDGRLTAHASIPDVRVGDIVDICFSLVGAHPVLRGRFCAEWVLNWQVWVAETRIRLISQNNRPIVVETHNDPPAGEIKALSTGDTVRTWRSTMTSPVVLEAFAPAWIRAFMSVRLCDAMTWPEVANALRDHYRAEPLPEDLKATMEILKGAAESEADRVVAALRLVQESLRYQAITLGDGGFVPRPIEAIWRSRTGDCKDASRLLSAILNTLGVPAEPFLVNTRFGRVLDDESPSLAAFDHCVVGLTLDGRRYWLDPTLFPQGGDLETLQQARFGWGLPLRPDATLEHMGEPPLAESFHVAEIYDLPKGIDDPGRLQVTNIYLGWRADYIRRRLAGGLADFTRDLLARHAQRFDGAVEIEPIKISDDRRANRLELVETVQLAKVWRAATDGRAIFESPDTFLRPNLPGISRDARRWPIHLGMPLMATSTIEIRVPIAAPAKSWTDDFELRGVRASSSLDELDDSHRTLSLRRTLTFEATCLEADETQAFVDFREALLRKASVAVRVPVRDGVVTAVETNGASRAPPAPAGALHPRPVRRRATLGQRALSALAICGLTALIAAAYRLLYGGS